MRYLVGEAMTGGYGDADILHDCTIGVDEGEIAVVVGPNGAGKSTAMKAVFGDGVPKISSTKSLSGHSLGAAGVQEAIYSLLMMNNDFIAASANIEALDEKAEGLPIVQANEDISLNTVMSNSFGFGGTNATLVFQKYTG